MYQKYVCKIFVGVSTFYIFKLLFKIHKKIKNVDKKLESITNIPCVVSEPDCKKNDKKIKLKCSKSCGTDEFTLFTNDFLHIRSYQNDISILKNMYAKDWVYDKEILELEESMSLATALELMNEKKNTCALLYDEKYNLVGILDTPDVLCYILRGCASLDTSILKVIRKCTVSEGHVTINEICKTMCSGLRHIAVFYNHKYQIISQRALVEAICHACSDDDEITSLLSQTVEQTHIGTRTNIINCKQTCVARSAFELMSAYDITSIPIVNNTEKLVGVISASDILYSRYDISFLEENVIRYIEKSRHDAGVSRSASTVVTCTDDDTLLSVLKKMKYEHVHHIYILKDDSIEGVISFIDILKFFSLNF